MSRPVQAAMREGPGKTGFTESATENRPSREGRKAGSG